MNKLKQASFVLEWFIEQLVVDINITEVFLDLGMSITSAEYPG